MFALIAWLREIAKTTAGVSAATAGAMLSTYNFVGLPHSLLVPMILTKVKQPYWVVAFAAICICTGTLGLAYAPRFDWFWIVPAGLGAMFIPIGLTLINLRSRTEEGATALSGFMQGAGYLIAAIGPFLVGYLHASTGGWMVPCWFLALARIVAAVCGDRGGAAGLHRRREAAGKIRSYRQRRRESIFS